MSPESIVRLLLRKLFLYLQLMALLERMWLATLLLILAAFQLYILFTVIKCCLYLQVTLLTTQVNFICKEKIGCSANKRVQHSLFTFTQQNDGFRQNLVLTISQKSLHFVSSLNSSISSIKMCQSFNVGATYWWRNQVFENVLIDMYSFATSFAFFLNTFCLFLPFNPHFLFLKRCTATNFLLFGPGITGLFQLNLIDIKNFSRKLFPRLN